MILQRRLDDPLITAESLGFHAQQTAEKLLKTLLTLHGLDYPSSHDLRVLAALLGQGGVVLPDEPRRIHSWRRWPRFIAMKICPSMLTCPGLNGLLGWLSDAPSWKARSNHLPQLIAAILREIGAVEE